MPGREHFGPEPSELLVHDEPHPCPYLPGQIARLPFRLPLARLDRCALAARLRQGDRRQGRLLYRTECPACRACEPIRVDVTAFRPSRTQRRIFRRGEVLFTAEIGDPAASAEKLSLYRRHKLERGLLAPGESTSAAAYWQFLVDTCTETYEIQYRYRGALVGVAVVDRAADALSAVYCYYDPRFSRFSPGTYSILKQISLCQRWGLRYLYLGLYIAACRPMCYKAQYLPHERLIDGEWRPFESARP